MSTPRFRLWAMACMTALGALSGCASLAPTCPESDEVQPQQLHGAWTVQLESTGPHWTLQLGPHPEHPGSLRGELTQGALRYPVVADLDQGEFTLEESHDGQRIAATWMGEVKRVQCDWLITGQRQWGDATRPPQSFEMRSHRLR
jgi:hypothetical protein